MKISKNVYMSNTVYPAVLLLLMCPLPLQDTPQCEVGVWLCGGHVS